MNQNDSVALAEYERIHYFITHSKTALINIGYDEFAIESFHDVCYYYTAHMKWYNNSNGNMK
jgi:hypothetical protein